MVKGNEKYSILCQFKLFESVAYYCKFGRDDVASDRAQMFTTIILALGLFSFLTLAFKTLVVVAQTFVLPGTPISAFKTTTNGDTEEGAWALVTGASDGIGREFALQLARAGFNILLVARNVPALQSVINDIYTANPRVRAKMLLVDFAAPAENAFKELEEQCKSLTITVLGISPSFFPSFVLIN
jgi:short chain dehydrogenase